MATVRRKGKSPKHTPKVGPRRSERRRKLDAEEAECDLVVDSSEETGDGSAEEEVLATDQNHPSPFFANMSLDVLAQVASATLEKEPKTEEHRPQRKMPKRGVQNCDFLNLQQIQQLSERSLLNLFSEMTSNEMTRNFTFTCYLIPGQCKERFTSFGNESRSRLQMKNHLYHHLEKLQVANEKAKGKLEFTAEPMPARKRRLAAMAEIPQDRTRGRKKTSSFTSLKNKRNQDILILPKGQLISLAELTGSRRSNVSRGLTSILKKPKKVSSENKSPKNTEVSSLSPKRCKKDASLSPSKKKPFKPLSSKRQVLHSAETEVSRSSGRSKQKPGDKKNGGEIASDGEKIECVLQEETERRIEENEQFIIDLLSRTQPHHDHCYTTIFGKKRGIDTLDVDSSDSEEEDEDVTVDVGDSNSYYGNFLHQKRRSVVPILLFRRVPGEEGTPMVCCEEIVGNDDDVDGDEGHTGQRPYPPMPKSALAKKGRIPVPEEEEEDLSFSEDEVGSPSIKRRKRIEKEGTAEWERKSALRCIRELKFKKKDDRSVPLICKICKDKTFTASATLMYHYRSHAGIKPFVCLICNTTFTRQHSLNYHMLIHNNQSRFTCKDCGRKFRHPSHFKEHLRRHTGETPFECTDCPQKFKTRNTYKRHLKTRHGKLLTANGIHIMSREEFLKVRTKPYRKGEDDESEEEDIPEEDLLDSGDEGSNSDSGPLMRGSPIFLNTLSGEGLPVHVIAQKQMSAQTSQAGVPVQQITQQLVSQATNQFDTAAPIHISQGHMTQQLAVQTNPLHGQILSTGQFLVPIDFKLVMS